MISAWYNEIDPYAAQWLRNLIQKQLITPGEVDERPIQDVKPSDLKSFARCHFFAGIAGWDIALQLARWPDDRPIWTGSAPCQPFSTAGKRLQFTDERHLWPFWFHLISVCRPPIVFGEQVANGSGPWLDLVLADLEGEDYAVGADVLPAAGVGAPHIRDRVWFVADSSGAERDEQRSQSSGLSGGFANGGLATDSLGDSLWNQSGRSGRPNGSGAPLAREPSANVGNAARDSERRQGLTEADERWTSPPGGPGWWTIEPRLGRVVDGFPTRAQRLRAYGNAIVPACAAAFIEAYLACRP